MSRRPRDAAATRKQILDAAETLFAKHGFGSTSLAKIGTLANTHKSLILHHFESKDGLWQAVKERRFSHFMQQQQDMFSRNPVTLHDLRESISGYFRLLQNDPLLVQLLARAELERDAYCSQFDQQRLAPFFERLEQAQAAGLIRPQLKPAHILLLLINVITQWFEAKSMFNQWHALQPDIEDLDQAFLDSVLEIVFNGIATVAGVES